MNETTALIQDPLVASESVNRACPVDSNFINSQCWLAVDDVVGGPAELPPTRMIKHGGHICNRGLVKFNPADINKIPKFLIKWEIFLRPSDDDHLKTFPSISI